MVAVIVWFPLTTFSALRLMRINFICFCRVCALDWWWRQTTTRLWTCSRWCLVSTRWQSPASAARHHRQRCQHPRPACCCCATSGAKSWSDAAESGVLTSQYGAMTTGRRSAKASLSSWRWILSRPLIKLSIEFHVSGLTTSVWLSIGPRYSPLLFRKSPFHARFHTYTLPYLPDPSHTILYSYSDRPTVSDIKSSQNSGHIEASGNCPDAVFLLKCSIFFSVWFLFKIQILCSW